MENNKGSMENSKSNARRTATFRTLKWNTFTVFPDLVGANYFIFGRYGLATLKLILIILASIAVGAFILILVVWIVILIMTVGQADINDILGYVLIPLYIGCGIIGVDLIWTVVDFILVATGNFKDGNGVKVNKSYPGYKTISRRERKLQKKNNKKAKSSSL